MKKEEEMIRTICVKVNEAIEEIENSGVDFVSEDALSNVLMKRLTVEELRLSAMLWFRSIVR
jgi:hypothetical protein